MTVKLIPIDRGGQKGLDDSSGAWVSLATLLESYYARGYRILDFVPMPAGSPHPLMIITDTPVEISGDIGTITGDVEVSTDGTTISQTPTVTAGAYSANDAVGGLLTFANAALITGGGGVIKDVIILDDAGQDVEMELWLFDRTFVAMADNAPWAPSEADLRNLVAIISTGDGAWFAAGTPSAARVECSQRYDCVGTSLFGQLVTRGTPTFAATDDVTAKIGLLQD